MFLHGDTIDVAVPETATRPRTEDMTAASTSKVQVSPRPTDFARISTANWTPPFPVTSEAEALRNFKAEWRLSSDELPVYEGYEATKQVLIVDLHDFEIYRSPNVGKEGRWFELISLHHMEVPNPKRLCFHGFLCLGNVKHYVQSIPIQDLSIEGYGDDIDSGVICYIRSELANRDTTYDIWYRLNKPTIEYQRYHEPFLWVARLGKYVIDYLESSSSRSVGLEDFRKQFCSWLLDRYSEDANFRKWHNAFRDQVDFRVGVNAYIDYLYLQAHNLPNSQQLLAHPLWRECMARGLTQVEAQNEVEKHTLATPDVYSLFRDMYFGENLRARSPIQRVKARQADRKRNLGFSGGPFSTSFTEPPSSSCRKYGMSPIRVGDVVAMNPDKNDLQHWRNADWEWLAYVQDVAQRPDGTQKLFVLWLYRPRETNIFKAKYGLHNELFMSDNCNCRAGELLSTHVNGRYDIDWSPKTVSTTRFFIRQTYITEDSAFVSLAEDHKTCSHRKKIPMPSDKYERGDTVYLERLLHRHKILDPVIVWSIDNTSDTVTIRRLSRLELDCADLAVAAGRKDISPNELVLTDEYEVVKSSRINRRCFVRFVSKTSTLSGFIPFPYDRHGAGDFWFLAMEVIKRKGMQYLDFLSRHPRCFREGPDMVAKSQMLKGLSLFSGGGSLDRGLEECGAVDFRTVVDISAPAIHTQRANARNPDQMRFYCGPVDDFFAAALSERDPGLVTQVGKVEIIAAGAPCPGYSKLQRDFESASSLKHASHITTFCSSVDLYRPQYGILENVVNMASTRKGHEDENVLSQVVACLVSMGYQVSQYIMDAWSYGSKQQRSRIILVIAAPGLTPIVQPKHTHSLHSDDLKNISLGTLLNGEKFGQREHYPTPFPYVPAGAIDDGLPDIANGSVQTCVPFPDHRLTPLPLRNERALIERIPKYPAGSGYKEAFDLNLIPPSLQKSKKETGKAYRRIKKDGLVPTITTSIKLQDSRNGATLHWREDRSISIQEARRTQGYRDDEPIIGTLREQYAIVGNGVDRRVSFAMGLSLRQAVEESHLRGHSLDVSSDELWDLKNAEQRESDNELGEVIHVKAFTRPNQTQKCWNLTRPQSTAFAVRTNKEKAKASATEVSAPDVSANLGVQPATSSQSTALLPDALSNRVRKLSLSPLTSFTSSSTKSSSVVKRSRVEETTGNEVDRDIANAQQPSPRKRARSSSSSRASVSLADTTELRDGASGSGKARFTRHSGLSVEYVPKQWNKKPEMEQREEYQRLRDSQNHHRHG